MKDKNFAAATEELKLSIGLLVRRMRAMAPSEQQELSWTQKSVIMRLETEGSLTAAELARAEGVKPQSMGNAVAVLEERGLIERKPRADDGRQIDIQLTAKAVAMRKAGTVARRNWLSEAIGQLSKNEQAILFEAGSIIRRLADL